MLCALCEGEDGSLLRRSKPVSPRPSTDSCWAGLSEEAELPEEAPEAVETVDMRRRVEDRMYGITTEPTRLFFFSVSELGCGHRWEVSREGAGRGFGQPGRGAPE